MDLAISCVQAHFHHLDLLTQRGHLGSVCPAATQRCRRTRPFPGRRTSCPALGRAWSVSVPPAPSAPPAPSRRYPAGPSSCRHWRHLSVGCADDPDTTGVGQTRTTFRTWARAVATTVRQTPTAANHVGVDTAAAKFGFDCAPTYNHPTAMNCVRANESVDHAYDGCVDNFRKPQRRTARECSVNQWCTV